MCTCDCACEGDKDRETAWNRQQLRAQCGYIERGEEEEEEEEAIYCPDSQVESLVFKSKGCLSKGYSRVI